MWTAFRATAWGWYFAVGVNTKVVYHGWRPTRRWANRVAERERARHE